MDFQARTNQEKFMRFYQDFQLSRLNECDNYKLVKCRSEKIEQLLNEVDSAFQIFDLRIKSGKTYGLIFDSKEYYAFTCALVNGNIKEQLDRNEEYYVKGGKNAKSITMRNRIDQTSNVISKIIVPATNWPALENIRLTVSPTNYTAFFKKCLQKAYFIDSIIIQMDPRTSLDDEMKLLVNHIKPTGLKPFIIFTDFTFEEYTENEVFRVSEIIAGIKDFDFISRDRMFTDFSWRNYNSNIVDSDLDFCRLKQMIEEELTMENVYDRFWTKAQVVMKHIEEIEKLIAADRSNVLNDVTHCENKLKIEKEKIVSTIQKSQHQMESELEEKIKDVMSAENKKSLNIAKLKNNIEPIIDKNNHNFRIQFNEQILNTIKTNNINFDKYVSDIYFNEYMKKTDYDDKLKDDIDKCLQEIQIELENDVMKVKSSQSIIGKVLSSVKNCVKEKYSAIKGSFDRFVSEFKDNVVRKYDETTQSVAAFKDTFLNEPEPYNDILNSIKLIINNSRGQMRLTIHDTIKSILDEIRSMESIEESGKNNIDLHRENIPKKLTDYRAVSERLSSSITDQIQQLNNEIRKTWPTRIREYYTEYLFRNFIRFVDWRLETLYKELSRKGLGIGSIIGAAFRAVGDVIRSLTGGRYMTKARRIYDLMEKEVTTVEDCFNEELDSMLEKLFNEISRNVT